MSGYTVVGYGRMLVDEERMSAYVASIRAAVKPGDVVLELGTGTGTMALIACQCGARHVYAVEPANVIHIAQKTARDNGFADRITFLRELSTRITLPEKCNVLISDLRGVIPCFSSHLADLMDARERLLTPDARWICQTDTLHVAVAEVPNREDRFDVHWDGSRWGLDLRAAIPYARSLPTRQPSARPEDLLTESRDWARIDYPALITPHVRGATVLTATRAGTARGLMIWFSAELFGGFHYSSAPEQPRIVYAPLMLPWEHAVELQVGDTIELQINAMYSSREYWWNWVSTVHREGCSAPVATFTQSSLNAQIFQPSAVQHDGNSAPELTTAGEETLFLLSRIDGQATPQALAAALRVQFPTRYPDEAAAAARVAQIRRDFTR